MSITLQPYREVARQAALKNKDLSVTRDAATDQLRVSVNNPLRRAIAWLRGKVSKSFRDKVAKGYHEFFEALRADADAGPHAARGARQLLAQDLRAGKPLSARHITRVMDRMPMWKLTAAARNMIEQGDLPEPFTRAPDQPPPQGAQRDALPESFDSAQFLARLDQEIARQEAELKRQGELPAQEPTKVSQDVLARMKGERDARALTRAEVRAGRNPLPALRAQAAAMAAAGNEDAAWAFNETVAYLENSGNVLLRESKEGKSARQGAPAGSPDAAPMPELPADADKVELMMLGGKIPRSVNIRALAQSWNKAAERFGAQLAGQRPANAVERERAQDIADVEGYLRQAVSLLNQGRDPRPELLRHAEVMENIRYDDNVTLAPEARQLRALAAEYEALLQATLGRRAAPDWLAQVKSRQETSVNA